MPRVAPRDQLEHNGARFHSGGGLLPTLEMRHPTLQLPPEVWERDAEQDDTPGGEAASGYSLSFGPLRSLTPSGAGGRPFGSAGAGRGLRVLFALSTAARDTVGLGRCEDLRVPSHTCAWRAVRSDVLEVQLDPNLNPNPNPNPNANLTLTLTRSAARSGSRACSRTTSTATHCWRSSP